MTITTTKCGVWILDDSYKKLASGYWTYLSSIESEPGTLWMWGNNSIGQLGNNTEISRSSPIQVPGTSWNDIAQGCGHTLARKTDGTLWAWGLNFSTFGGQLGDNTSINKSSPIQIPGTAWNQIDASAQVGVGGTHSLATKTDGTLWAWGSATYAVDLGEGNFSYPSTNALGPNVIGKSISSPVQVPGATWCDISTGYHSSYAIKTEGTLWVWGRAFCGASGTGVNSFSNNSPVQIPGTSWIEIRAADSHGGVFARKTDGTLWGWGRNAIGELGQNNTVARSSPVQIPGTTWSSLSRLKSNTVLARKTDGTLWAWGQNQLGELGDGTTTCRSSPVQIPGTSWSTVSSSTNTMALKTDGTLWVWGNNTCGALGDNTTIIKSSPIQIPGFWNDVSVDRNSTSAARKSS